MARNEMNDDSIKARKSYEAPRLRVYGNMTDWTKTVGTTKSNKDGGSNNTKTA